MPYPMFFKHWVKYLVTPKIYLGASPYFLVYGKQAILTPNIFLSSLQLSLSS